MKAYLVCGGDVTAAFLNEVIKKEEHDLVFAVDGGITALTEAAIVPDILIGDFDTASKELVSKYEELCTVVRHPPEKDATDSELAVDMAITQGADEIILLGATGSRMDHSLANLHMLYRILLEGKKGELRNKTNRITLYKSSFHLKKEELFGDYLSFLPFLGEIKDLTLTGVKYPLFKRLLLPGSSLCISNEVVQKEVDVEFSKGFLFMIESKD